ncbi:MAG TPA: DUF3078 domain-containing protein [Bacteroidota bacterium]|nr:DUF3078 domain-containing protein [Bacteroidota bacterium]
MKSIIVLSAIVLASSIVLAQASKEDQDREKKFQEHSAAATADTSKEFGWKHAMVSGLNLTQISFKDWAAGGDNALSYTLYLNGSSTLNEEKVNWGNSYKFAFGETRLGSQGIRKTDDEIYFESLLIYKVGVYVNPYLSATLRSQFAVGYTYDNAGNATSVSKFFDPGYLTQSAGVAYQPIPEVKTRIGLGVREIITSQFNQYASEPGSTAVHKTRVDGGIEWVTEASFAIAENMTLGSRVEMFDPFKAMDRLFFLNDNLITAKVNKYIAASVGVQILNDVNVSPRTQIKQVFALGFTYAIL